MNISENIAVQVGKLDIIQRDSKIHVAHQMKDGFILICWFAKFIFLKRHSEKCRNLHSISIFDEVVPCVKIN